MDCTLYTVSREQQKCSHFHLLILSGGTELLCNLSRHFKREMISGQSKNYLYCGPGCVLHVQLGEDRNKTE